MEAAFLKQQNADLKTKVASLEAHIETISKLHEGIVKGHSDYIAEQAKHMDFLVAQIAALQAEIEAMKNPNPAPM